MKKSSDPSLFCQFFKVPVAIRACQGVILLAMTLFHSNLFASDSVTSKGTSLAKYSVVRQKLKITSPQAEWIVDVFEPQENNSMAKPAVFVIHGGGWKTRIGDMSEICERLAENGYVAFNLRYRLAPEFHHPTQVEDLKFQMQYIQKNQSNWNLDGQYFGWGYSAGAHLLMLIGLENPELMQGLVAGGTPADLTGWSDSGLVLGLMGQPQSEAPGLWQKASPVFNVTEKAPPLLMYHGTWDWIVPHDHAMKLKSVYEKVQRPVELVDVPYRGHLGAYFFASDAEKKAIEFFNRLQKKK